MLYRPNAHGEIVAREWTPDYLGRLELRHLSKCVDMAVQFWRAVLSDVRISDDFKGIAHRHMTALRPLGPLTA